MTSIEQNFVYPKDKSRASSLSSSSLRLKSHDVGIAGHCRIGIAETLPNHSTAKQNAFKEAAVVTMHNQFSKLRRPKFWTQLLFASCLLICHFPSSSGALNRTVDVCTLNGQCLNGGTCEPADNTTPARHCHCADGYSGSRCEVYCPLNCMNGGLCTRTPQGMTSSLELATGDFYCKCYGRYAGPLCETPFSNCGHAQRCYNGGTCIADSETGKHK